MDDKKFQDLMKDLYNERKKYKDKINKIPDGYEKHILSETPIYDFASLYPHTMRSHTMRAETPEMVAEMKRKAREKKLRRIMGDE